MWTYACTAQVAIHWALLVSPEARNILFWKIFGMLGCYAVGFVFYASRAPERFRPGMFDFVAHSHQIWHLLVFAAVYIWYLNSVKCHELLATRGCQAFIADAPLLQISRQQGIENSLGLGALRGHLRGGG
mmetsp:Transcript_24651/g.72298  ORF Transcript_24651/g.72298 Transcript_24651/m.72298 type:complete len:130 (+) Transcript_24651:757-1146(+)